MFQARKANKRVEILQSDITPDGFGGNVVSSIVVTQRWCNIEDVGSNSYQSDAGITDFTDTQKFTFRYDKNFTINPKIHTLKYRGIIYSILDVKTNGFKNVQQIVIAKIAFGIGNTNEIVRSLVLQNGNNLVVQDGNSLILE
tara:strand:+ start:60 stop:485 length:426 start_codon:yes stop_codon:yes gene_type:complete